MDDEELQALTVERDRLAAELAATERADRSAMSERKNRLRAEIARLESLIAENPDDDPTPLP